MLCMNQKRKGEFQEVDCGNYFTFGDLKDCPDDCLKNWAEEQSWYNDTVNYSFIRINCWDGAYYRVSVIEGNVAFVNTSNKPYLTKNYKEWEKWQIKNHVIYK